MSGSYILKRSTDQKYYFNLAADNNEKVLTSETYNVKQSALDGISSVRINSPLDTRFIRKTSSRGLNFFVLTAANGEPIGTSEEYSSAQAMEDSILVVIRIGPLATLKDLT